MLRHYKCPAHLQKTCEISGLLTDSLVDVTLLSVSSTWIHTRSIERHKCFDIGNSHFQKPSQNSIILLPIAALSLHTSSYVTPTSFMTLPVLYEVTIAASSDECCEHKRNPGIVFMCELAEKLELYRAAISVSDADSHFFPKQKNSCSRNSLNVCTSAQEYIDMKIR